MTLSEIKRKALIWFVLQVALPVVFIVYIELLSDHFSVIRLLESQKLTIVGVMALLSVITIRNLKSQELDVSEDDEAKLYNLIGILGFIVVFMVYSILLTRSNLFDGYISYVITSVAFFIFIIAFSFLLLLKHYSVKINEGSKTGHDE